MTYLEKYLEKHPKAEAVHVMMYSCPAIEGLEPYSEMPCGGEEANEMCKGCWEREWKHEQVY